MIACPRCGHEAEPDDAFCLWCGAALGAAGKDDAAPRTGPTVRGDGGMRFPRKLRRLLTRAGVAWVVALIAVGAVAGLWMVSAANDRDRQRELRATVAGLREALAARGSSESTLREELDAAAEKIEALEKKLEKARAVATTGEASTPVVTEQGGTYWGVYLAVGDGPDLEDAIQYLTEERGLEFGLEFSVGDIGCDHGAREALGDFAGPQRVAAYFDTEGDARAWADSLPAPPVGLAEVQTFSTDETARSRAPGRFGHGRGKLRLR